MCLLCRATTMKYLRSINTIWSLYYYVWIKSIEYALFLLYKGEGGVYVQLLRSRDWPPMPNRCGPSTTSSNYSTIKEALPGRATGLAWPSRDALRGRKPLICRLLIRQNRSGAKQICDYQKRGLVTSWCNIVTFHCFFFLFTCAFLSAGYRSNPPYPIHHAIMPIYGPIQVRQWCNRGWVLMRNVIVLRTNYGNGNEENEKPKWYTV